MFKIGEFSKLTQVSIRMLRYYDETGLLRPAAIDGGTGYRSYTTDQIPTLNKVVFLRDLGFTVAEMAVALNQWDNAFISCQLSQKRRAIEATIQAEKDKLAKLDLALRDIQQAQLPLHYSFILKAIPSTPVFSLRRVIPDYYAEGLLWKEMLAYVSANRIALTQETFTIYHDTDYREQDVDVELCAVAPHMGESRDGFVFRTTEAVPTMASSMVYGPFERIAGAYRAFAGWLQTHTQYRMLGQSRQIVHRGPWNEGDPEKHLTEIQIPLEKIKPTG